MHRSLEIVFPYEIVWVVWFIIDFEVKLPTYYIKYGTHEVAHCEDYHYHAKYSKNVAEHDSSHYMIVVS